MKTSSPSVRRLLSALTVITLTSPTFAATIAKWDFTGNVGNETSEPVVAVSLPTGITASAVTRGAGIAATSAAGSLNSNGWSTLDLTEYLEFSVTVQSGYVLDLNSVSFANRRSSTTAPSTVILRRFTAPSTLTDIGTSWTPVTTTTPVADNDKTVTFPSDYDTLPAGTYTFRIMGSGATSATSTYRIFNHSVLGGLIVDGTVTSSGTPLALSATPSSIFFETGGATAAQLTVTIPAALGSDLEVTFSNPDTSELTLPASATITAGNTFVAVDVAAVNDNALDGDQAVLVSVSAPGYVASNLSFTVIDVPPPIAPMTGTGSYSQNFDSLISSSTATWTDHSTLSSWYAKRSGTGTNITADNGTSTTGSLYSFGATSTTDRALGSLGGGSANHFALALQLRNTSAGTTLIDNIAYTGEQWRYSGTAAAQAVTLWYKTSATQLSASDITPNSTTGWSTISSGGFTSPIISGTSGALDGNLPANRVAVSATSSISVPAGHFVMIRWEDPDHTGSDHALAIDDLTVSWVPLRTVALSATSTSFAENTVGTASTVTVTLTPPATGETVVTVTNPDVGELTTPATVIFADGQSVATFDVAALNDGVPDGNKIVTLTASADTYISGTVALTVTDVAPQLSLSASLTSFAENATSQLTVGISASQGTDTSVVIAASTGLADITFPTPVVIPVGETSVVVTLTGVPDSVFDGNKTVTLTATATIAQQGNTVVTVTDIDTVPLRFSQYYEGASNNKFLELENTSASSFALSGFYLANFTAEGWKTINTPAANAGPLANVRIASSGTLLIAHPSATTPAYATSGTNYTNGSNARIGSGATFFGGDDSVILYYDFNGDSVLTPSEVVDAFSFTLANEGGETSFHRISGGQGFNLTAGSKITDFPAVWETKTLAAVDAAVPADPFYLQGAVLPISLSPSVSSFAEDATSPASVVTVSVPYNVTANTTVTLAVAVGGSPDATEITVPASVIILSGTSSITFDVAALTDATADGSQIAILTATATGYSNGTAALTVTDIDVATYSSWQNTYFTAPELANSLVSGDNADPDGDGLSNALEYAFGTLPTAGTSAAYLPQSVTSGNTLALSYLRPVGGGVPGVAYSVQVLENTDLVSGNGNWVPAVLTTDYNISTTTVGTPAGTEKVTITFVAPVTQKKFGRIGVAF